MRIWLLLGKLFSFFSIVSTWKISSFKPLKKFTAGALISASMLNIAVVPPALAEVSLQQQLKELQSKKIDNIKNQYESAEMAAMNQELTYQPGYLLARGGIMLNQDKNNVFVQIDFWFEFDSLKQQQIILHIELTSLIIEEEYQDIQYHVLL